MRVAYGGKGQRCRFWLVCSRDGWGIAAKLGEEYAAVPGLFCEKAEARRFAKACARARLEPCHLWDAAEDWLADKK